MADRSTRVQSESGDADHRSNGGARKLTRGVVVSLLLMLAITLCTIQLVTYWDDLVYREVDRRPKFESPYVVVYYEHRWSEEKRKRLYGPQEQILKDSLVPGDTLLIEALDHGSVVHALSMGFFGTLENSWSGQATSWRCYLNDVDVSIPDVIYDMPPTRVAPIVRATSGWVDQEHALAEEEAAIAIAKAAFDGSSAVAADGSPTTQPGVAVARPLNEKRVLLQWTNCGQRTLWFYRSGLPRILVETDEEGRKHGTSTEWNEAGEIRCQRIFHSGLQIEVRLKGPWVPLEKLPHRVG